MPYQRQIPGWKDRVLFTPGPLTTSPSVKQAMLRDLGSRDHEFLHIVRLIRRRLIRLAGATPTEYTTVLMQGSGTFGLEAVVSSTIPPEGQLMVLVNGAYGRRIAQMARMLGIRTHVVECPENRKPQLDEIESELRAHPDVSMLAIVHCETTTGLINPIAQIGALAAFFHVQYFVDAMSSFGAIPIDLARYNIDYLVSSANKCIEGVPGFSFVLARLDALRRTKGYARSLSLDLYDQWTDLEDHGQFRFTPPTHAILAFHEALREFEAEGRVAARAARYEMNYRTLLEGMQGMGFVEYLAREDQGYIITSFRYPPDPRFDFSEFYDRLHARGYVIYSGKVSNADCFRVGTIGRIFPCDVRDLLAAIRDVLTEMGVELKSLDAAGKETSDERK